ncbi:fimbrillin family protein [Parabacteroides sp.]
MKIRSRITESILGGIALLLTACSGNLPGDGNTGGTDSPGTPEEKGEPVSITFDMGSAIQTRAEDGTTQDEIMEAGNTFRIYVYDMAGMTNTETPNFSSPMANSVYTVKLVDEKLVATGDLTLYRGTYYMYLVSYNSDSEQPENVNGKINVVNGKDFMYTVLPNVVVQPQTSGSNQMSVKLPTPFKRLGSQVQVSVAAKNGQQPVAITTLKVDRITVKGLHSSLDYSLSDFKWKDSNSDFNADYTFYGGEFTRKDNNTTSFWTSPPKVLLPVDGSELLTFDVTLIISYNEGEKEINPTYTASMQKVLMPGMTYQFDFLLTFYGELIPADLTLAVKEYNEIELDSDGLGAD